MKFYKCNICGNVVDLVVEGGGTLVCCGEDMELLTPKEMEEGSEKHLPVATLNGNKLTVRVGSVPHPMEENHFINFILLKYNGKVGRKDLNPGEAPEKTFTIDEDFTEIEIYEYCNVHGLWKTTFRK